MTTDTPDLTALPEGIRKTLTDALTERRERELAQQRAKEEATHRHWIALVDLVRADLRPHDLLTYTNWSERPGTFDRDTSRVTFLVELPGLAGITVSYSAVRIVDSDPRPAWSRVPVWGVLAHPPVSPVATMSQSCASFVANTLTEALVQAFDWGPGYCRERRALVEEQARQAEQGGPVVDDTIPF